MSDSWEEEANFCERIDACLPYTDGDQVVRLIREASTISCNALMHVVWEILVPPRPVALSNAQKLAWVEVIAGNAPADFPVPLEAIRGFLRGLRLQQSAALLLLEELRSRPGEYNAAAVIIIMTQDDSQDVIEAQADGIKSGWDKPWA